MNNNLPNRINKFIDNQSPLERVYGGKRLKEIKTQELNTMKEYFKGAKLTNKLHMGKRLWVNKEGKFFAAEGDYPDLEPTSLSDRITKFIKKQQRCKFVISTDFDKNGNYKEKRCGQPSTHTLAYGGKASHGLCEEHAKYQEGIGHKTIKL